jgi:hypothetical protein
MVGISAAGKGPVDERAPKGQAVMEKLGAGKLTGLLLGCLVAGVMIFMMFAVLGGLLSGD